MTIAAYHTPGSLPEALELLDAFEDDLLVLAGGTVAMPLINEGVSQPARVMGLRHAGLDEVREEAGTIELGATRTLTRLLDPGNPPILQEAARNTASWSVRNMATIGGNLFTPPPGGDIAVALLALDASVRLASSGGTRLVPLRDFYTGFMTSVLRPGELLTAIVIPEPAGTTAYLKLGRKMANTPAVVTVAVRVVSDAQQVVEARIALGAAGPHPIRASAAEATLVGSRLEADAIRSAAEAATADCEPFTDAVASAWYRRRMVGLFVGRALQDVARNVGPEDR
jgi:CO/xanthine dehydrogenase FAD-binding subunit